MRQLLSVFYLVALNATSHVLTGLGEACHSASTAFYNTFIQAAVRHDMKYALKDNEQSFFRKYYPRVDVESNDRAVVGKDIN